MQGTLKTPAHLDPDLKPAVLRVRLLHQSATADRRLEPLDAPNASRTRYPGTELRLVYEFTTWGRHPALSTASAAGPTPAGW